MGISSTQLFKLKKFVKDLEKFRGRHTELVSVYIPQDYDLNKIQNHLNQEQGTAENIKSTSTRKNVIAALEKMIQHLKLYTKTPAHGLAAFAGNIAEREGVQDVRAWSVEPPVPLQLRLYRCDKEFVLEPLRDMCESKVVYGLVVMDRRDAHIALLRGKSLTLLTKTHSEVPGKYKAGGQSALRFERLREGAAHEHYKKVGEYMKQQFLSMTDLKGIIVGGPGPTKYEFVDGDYITNDVKKKIVAIKDLSYTEEFGLQELLDRSQDVLAAEAVADEKQSMNQFFTLLATQQKKVAYGHDHVKRCLEMGMVDTLLLSESIDDDTILEFEKIAEQFNSTVKIISTETREGVQLRDLGKFAAVLRYELHE